MQNPRLAGYMLTGNLFMFLSTNGSLAWLYHCPLMRSPPHVMNQCYNKIPMFHKKALFCVNLITRQTYLDAQVQKCSDRIKNLFQFDVEDENSLFSTASQKALQKFSRELIVPNTAIHGPEKYSYHALRTDFFVDEMIFPNYFKNQFMDTFGSIAYVLEFCGIYFSCFLFIKLIVDLIVMDIWKFTVLLVHHLELARHF